MAVIAGDFEVKDQLFVKTKASRELKCIVKETHWATILGKPGDGKSATAAHLMHQYRDEGYEPILISSPQEWRLILTCDPALKQFAVINDMFGTSYLDKRKADGWLSMIENMERVVKARKGSLIVVWTSRRYIYSDVESALDRYVCFGKSRIVDMTDKPYILSGDEKLEIFNKFGNAHDVTLDDNSLRKLPALDPPHGFPHYVELFCTNAFLRETGLSFFENPTKYVQREICNFKDNDPTKFLVLLLVLLNADRLNAKYFSKLINEQSEDEVQLF